MNAMMRKDVRALNPIFIATIAVTILAALLFNGSDSAGAVIICYAPAAAFLAATIFGNEFSSRTMTQLLSQPIPREQIWRNKISVLGVELAISYVVLFAAFSLKSVPHIAQPHTASLLASIALALAALPLICFCSTPCMTLLTKNTLGAIAFTITTPFSIAMLFLLADTGLCWLLGRPQTFGETLSAEHPVLTFSGVAVGVLIYCATMYRFGYRVFMEYQVIDSQSKEIALPAVFERKLARWTAGMAPRVNHPLASLIWKELRLHRVSFILAGVAAIVSLVAIFVGVIHHSVQVDVAMFMPIVLCILAIPLLSGLVTVAEERNMGVLEWQLTQPVSRGKQWMIKLLTTICVCIGLGVLLPAAIFYVGHSFFGFGPKDIVLQGPWREIWPSILANALVYFFGFSLVVFGSSISTNIAGAMATTFGISVCIGSVFGLTNYVLSKAGLSNEHFRSGPFDVPILIVIGCAFIGIVLANLLSFTNFRHVQPSASRIWKQFAVLALLAAFFSCVLFLA